MTNTSKSVMVSVLAAVKLSNTILLPDRTKIKWLPLLQCGDTKYRMGILEDGDWAVELKDGVYRLNESYQYFRVIVFLEQPLATISEMLKSFLNSISIKVDVYEFFPFDNIVKAGLEQGSNYWATLAFEWYQNLPIEMKISLFDSISILVNAKWASQMLRQKAMKEIKRLDAHSNEPH